MDELSASLTLARVPSLDARTLTTYLERFGGPTQLVTARPAVLRDAGIPAQFIDAVARAPAGVRADLSWLDRDARHHFIPWHSDAYPALLRELSDPPVALFVRGNPDVLALPQLAIVGSRNPTPSGRETAEQFARHLAQCGLTITSGLAVGIDTASHRGALEAPGTTIAVCGTGLDIAYPHSNQELADAIAVRGALVSEFPLGTPPLKAHFPRRNRIICGLALGTLVVEAALQSGSLITARLAAEQGREVFAIPGSIHNPLARGCHRLLRQGAKLVESAQDIFEELRPLAGALAASLGPDRSLHAGLPSVASAAMGRSPSAAGAGAQERPSVHGEFPPVTGAQERPPAKAGKSQANFPSLLHKGHEILLDALGFEPAGVDLLVERTGLRADEVASMLLVLELEGRIGTYPGGLYVRHVQRE